MSGKRVRISLFAKAGAEKAKAIHKMITGLCFIKYQVSSDSNPFKFMPGIKFVFHRT
jgi:hypothetical protein